MDAMERGCELWMPGEGPRTWPGKELQAHGPLPALKGSVAFPRNQGKSQARVIRPVASSRTETQARSCPRAGVANTSKHVCSSPPGKHSFCFNQLQATLVH